MPTNAVDEALRAQGRPDRPSAIALSYADKSKSPLVVAKGYGAAADAFKMWNKANGHEMAGLSRRRAAERALYLEGV